MKITDDILYVGVNDHKVDLFEGQYVVPNGMAYNSYVIKDEKIAVMDTVDANFTHEWLDNIATVLNGAKPDYLIVQHMEPDHSANIAVFMETYPEAQIVSSAKAFVMMQQFFGTDFPERKVVVGEGSTLKLGRHTLTFVTAPMVHWPDSMVTYDELDGILFSNDAFGQHYASSKRFDDEVGLPEVLVQAQKYYANIVMPYGKNVEAALKALSGLSFDMIAPAHGIIWRSHVPEILAMYEKWSSGIPEEYALVVYDSMWHTTEAMATEITEAFIEMGIPARLLDLKVNHISDIMAEVLNARYIAVGSPTLNKTMMPTVASFLCYMRGLAPAGRVGIPFGSYGWAPMGPNEVYQALESCKFTLPEAPLTHQWVEDEEGLNALHDAIVDYVSLFHERA